MDFYYSYTNALAPVPWSPVNLSKIILTMLTIILDLVVILQNVFWKGDDKVVYTMDWVAPGLKIATYVSLTETLHNFFKCVCSILPRFLDDSFRYAT